MNKSRIMEIIRTISPIILLILFAVGSVVFIIKWSERIDRADSDIHYLDDKCVIVGVGGFQGRTHDKYATAYAAKYFLIRRVVDTTMYFEMNNWNWRYIGFTDSMYYNHRVGDTLRFAYIGKKRFFKVTRPLNIRKGQVYDSL